MGNEDYDLENFPGVVGVKGADNLYRPYPIQDCTHYYLPLVYSCSEKMGLNLFASFLNSLGFTYVVLQKSDDSGRRLEREKIRATKKTYKMYPPNIKQNIITEITNKILHVGNSDTKELIDTILNIINASPVELRNEILSTPLCVLLTPDMTEGIDCKFNPAILLMEPPNTYGDYDQLCGRVLRTYSTPYEKPPQKMIYQFVCFNYDNLLKIYESMFIFLSTFN